MNRLVAQAFQPAGLPDFRVRWTRNGRLESRPNPQARKPALRTRFVSWSQCAKYDVEVTHEPERRAAARRGAAWRAPNAPTWRSALQARGSWSQCAPELAWWLPMNLGWFGVPPLGGSNGLGRLKPGLQAVRGSWSQCATKKACRLPMNRCLAGI